MRLTRCAVALSLLVVGSLVQGCASSGDKKKPLTKTERAAYLVDIAHGLLMEGDSTAALRHLFMAEEEDPKLPALHHSKALVYFTKNDLESAIASARVAVQLKPDYSDANNTLGKLLIDAGKYEEAIFFLSKVLKDPIYGEIFKPLTNLGIVHYRRAEYNKALEYFERAIKADPINSCVAHYYKGHLELRESHFNQAIRSYESATRKFCANFPDAHLALGIAFERSKQFDKARQKFLEVQQRYPNSKFADQAMNRLNYLP